MSPKNASAAEISTPSWVGSWWMSMLMNRGRLVNSTDPRPSGSSMVSPRARTSESVPESPPEQTHAAMAWPRLWWWSGPTQPGSLVQLA